MNQTPKTEAEKREVFEKWKQGQFVPGLLDEPGTKRIDKVMAELQKQTECLISIRRMLMFFTVLAIIGIIAALGKL